MNAVVALAANEFRLGLRNRWVALAILLLGGLALALALLGKPHPPAPVVSIV